ncbi:ATP-dependent helicase HrpA [Microbacterium endophyticum]|uniref:ATP-dependent helicase HrpA n=1 Tax=Microbacterium endophyticum TaxID=1526412 RepID=A0A7W4YL82_9MICO|nr:ATP-dependent RNA helicase HrpA [Microbacterium endophyticum]MBB2974903.1 ATP-dependent helicase HrpA [Microbacterium endophyticum]NIK37200.1 ATP-dependent helicase HrpA [Microbacterium endophyticum]
MSEPVITFPPELPVSAAREEIARAIKDNQVVIVAGATGSGKTTQLPKICLELGRTKIAHTQPRRIAARSIAERIASELEVPLGTAVGYKVRFTDKVSAETSIALMTDGILLNEIHRDRLLRRYDTIIVDEAHERSLNIDFLLGYLTRILPERPDLKVIITSATIDPQSFAAHFADASGNPAPVIEVSGRTYPVDIRYRPPNDEDDLDGLVAALRELDREATGDVLVFLPGEAEIRDAADAVRGAYAKDAAPTEVLPLYGRLSAAEQHRVFEPSRIAGVRRRVVLATNVAETSLTVPGIRYVVDIGTARITRYSPRSKIQRLPIEAISQASAQQRAGRAGRTAPGIAIRLYAEDDFASRDEFTDPEILRTSLASVILQMLALGFGDITAFPFLTPPDSRGVKAAFDLLLELGAVRTTGSGKTARTTLTDTGRELSRLPIDPRFARMLVEAKRGGVLADVMPIVAGMSIQDVRERPEEVREQADRLHARFTDPTSDFLSLLNLWNYLQEQQEALGSSAFRRLCRSEHLNYVRVREWVDVHRQLSAQLGRLRGASDAADPDAVHKAIMAGLLSQIGILDERTPSRDAKATAKDAPARRGGEYLGARGARFAIFPGSGLKKKRPAAVMAAELVETSRLFARTVAAIDPEWAEALAPDLIKRQVSDPHWSKDAGAAVAAEKITLFGVEIVPRRRIQLARIDRPLAREMFLRHALVEEEWDATRLDKKLTAFVRRNLELRRRLEKIEERERRRDILVGDEAVYAFYDTRIPNDVFDVRSFESWWREAMTRTPRLLDMSENDLVDDASRADERDFPTRWRQRDQVLSLTYRFEPGAVDDGVTVVVPLALLASITEDGFDWQVPGLRPELITGLLRALPKAIRRHVVPAADWAATFAEQVADLGPENTEGAPRQSLRVALASLVQRVANQPVTADSFELERVPAHLHVSFRAVDERGRTVGSDRDLTALQSRLAARTRSSVERSLRAHKPEPAHAAARVAAHAPTGPSTAVAARSGLTTWDIDDLPAVVDSRVAGGIVRGYPALIDDGESVSVRIEATPEAAAVATTAGVRRLVLLAVPSAASYVLEHLTAKEKLALAASPYASAKALIEDCRVAVADDVISRLAPATGVRTKAEFEQVRAAFSAASVETVFNTVSLTARILTLSRDVERSLKSQNSMTLLGALGDIRGQLAGLIFPGFVSRTGSRQLTHLPRYLNGILSRLQILPDNPGRDRTRMTEFERAQVAFTDAGGTIPVAVDAPTRIAHTRWLLEEYRVSLFAQTLGTAQAVSLQRIQKALKE